MGADGNQNLGSPNVALFQKVGANHFKTGVFAVAAGTRLKRSPGHSGNGGKVFQEVVHHR